MFDSLSTVKKEDEVGKTSSYCIDPVDLNHFFGEDGKIYGYKDLKVMHEVRACI